MSKFSTFLVFVFGVFVMIAIAVMFTQKQFFPLPPPAPEEKLVLPECNLASLDIGTREQFGVQLDKLFAASGLEAVRQYLEKEFVPGRVLMAAESATDPLTERRLVDREMRSCDADGVAPLDKPPLLPRASAGLRVGPSVHLHRWVRTNSTQPFVVTLWWVPGGK